MPSSREMMRTSIIAPILFFSACALGPIETSAPRTYFLNPEISRKNTYGYGERTGASVLLIMQPRARAGFDTARMAYLLRPYEVNYYAFNQWADTPARLLHRIMVENLEKTGLWGAVLQPPAAVPLIATILFWNSSSSPAPAACA